MVNNLAGAVAADIMGGIDSQGGACNFVANYDVSNNILPPVAETYLTAGAYSDLNSAPTEDRRAITDPVTMARSVASFSGLLNPQAEISEQYRSGMLRTAWGLDYYKDQTVLKHTCGTLSLGRNGERGDPDRIDHHGQCDDWDDQHWRHHYNRWRQRREPHYEAEHGPASPVRCHCGGDLGRDEHRDLSGIIPADLLGNPVQYQTVDVSPANGRPSSYGECGRSAQCAVGHRSRDGNVSEELPLSRPMA